MWHEDGLPAKHPPVCLVLQSYTVRQKLQEQGRIVLNTYDLDVNVTINDISGMLTEDTEQVNAAGN